MRNVGGRETFIATPRRSRLVGAGPSMPKRSFSSHPGASASPSPHLSFAYRERWATTQHGARSTEPEQGIMQHTAFLPCISSNLHIFSGSVKAEGSTFLLTDGLLILYATHVQLPNRRFPAANPLCASSRRPQRRSPSQQPGRRPAAAPHKKAGGSNARGY